MNTIILGGPQPGCVRRPETDANPIITCLKTKQGQTNEFPTEIK